MILLVNDANILCDLLKADLIEPFFRLEYEFHVSDLVFNEVREDNLADLEALMGLDKLIKTTFEFEELVENNLISCNTALEKLNYILCINPRLPRAECRKRIAKWKKSS